MMVMQGGVGSPGFPGPEAEIRRLRRRVAELEETNRALHEKNQSLVAAQALAVSQAEADTLREALREARDSAAGERARADHHAEEHAAAVQELNQLRDGRKGAKR